MKEAMAMATFQVRYTDSRGYHYMDEVQAPSWRLAKLAMEEAGAVILEVEEVPREMAHEAAIQEVAA
jgi:ketopantoate hydroxymethyltransferase